MEKTSIHAVMAAAVSLSLACGGPEGNEMAATDTALAEATGTVQVRILGDAVAQGAIQSTPISDVSLYDGDWHAVAPLGQTDANGVYVATLSQGAHQISAMKMTSSHSLLQSVGNAVTVTESPSQLDIHVAPTQVRIETPYAAGFGNAIYITGETAYLGQWKTAYKLTYQQYNATWGFLQNLPIGAQFKLILAPWTDAASIPVTAPGVRWESGGNRTITPPANSYESYLSISPSF
jgi:hypothetical protein